MLTLVNSNANFYQLQRPLRIDVPAPAGWPFTPHPNNSTLAGPIVVDVYAEVLSDGTDDLVKRLIDTAELFLRANGATEESIRDMKSCAWRSAHQYITENVSLVDRGPELSELSRLLRVDS